MTTENALVTTEKPDVTRAFASKNDLKRTPNARARAQTRMLCERYAMLRAQGCSGVELQRALVRAGFHLYTHRMYARNEARYERV